MAGTANIHGGLYAAVTAYNISVSPPTIMGRYMNLSDSAGVDQSVWIIGNEYLLTGTNTMRLFSLQNFTEISTISFSIFKGHYIERSQIFIYSNHDGIFYQNISNILQSANPIYACEDTDIYLFFNDD